MGPIEDRLRASVRHAAINGDARERGICGHQMLEAAAEIERLRAALRSDSPESERCETCYRKMALRCVVCDHTDRVYRNAAKLPGGPASTGGPDDR